MRKLLVLLVVMVLLGGCAEPSEPEIVVTDAWSRESPQMANAGAVFMLITNNGGAPDALIGASADVCEAVELHQSIMEGDVMKMRPVEGGRIEIPNNESVALEPGGLHVMLIGLTQELMPGDVFTLQLAFEKSGAQAVQVEVKEAGTTGMGE